MLSTLYLDRPQGSEFERVFGIGYYRKRMRAEGLEVREDTYAPFGDDPLLLHDVTIAEPDRPDAQGQLVRVLGRQPVRPQPQRQPRHRARRSGTPSAQTLTVAQANDAGDTKPETIFAAALNGPVTGYETSIEAFFGVPPSRAQPAARRRGHDHAVDRAAGAARAARTRRCSRSARRSRSRPARR